MTTTPRTHRNSEAAIFGRLWDGGDRLSPPVARHVLTLGFSPEDEARMHALAERCRDGRLTAAEREEYDNFIRVGDLLAILHSKARVHLKQPPATRTGHG